VLTEVARRLTAVARRADTVARLGGDEFVVLCEELSSDADLNGIADRIVRSIGSPFHCGGDELSLSASVGACETSHPHADPERLLHDTDAAMYHAKRRGGNQHQLFTASPYQAPAAAAAGQRRDAGSVRA
jgi:diguanylate cyclase (GGDEF)-like protein